MIFAATQAADNFGLGGRPWFGYYDGGLQYTPGSPYTLTVAQLQPGGATARSGIRPEDRLDLRDQDFTARVYLMGQPAATKAITLNVRRGAQRFATSFTGSTWKDVQPAFKLFIALTPLLTCVWCFCCVLLIATRRSRSQEGRVLAIVLTSLGIGGNGSIWTISVPDPIMDVLLWFSIWFVGLAASALLVRLASGIGVRTVWRGIIEWCAYAAIAFIALGLGLGVFGLVTLRVDPMAFSSFNPYLNFGLIGVTFVIVAVAVAAVANTASSERPRAAWLLLPLPIALAAVQVALTLENYATSWVQNVSLAILSDALALLAALFVTYALLKRRVLDTSFLLSRTIVVGIVSLIVVVAFVLLEWLLGLTLTGASHATGLIANAMLALAIGVSLQFIHRRVDAFVDAVLFRKRHDDERALREFSKEAAFVTEREALVDRAVELIRAHTDARNAALLVRENGAYKAARRFGEAPADVDENDPAILALKAWHRPVDPHAYASAMRGDLAVPMVARGHLVGVLLCGERAGGEAYAPDEVDALSEFAHGVGGALDALRNGADEGRTHVLLGSIDARLQGIERLLSDGRQSNARFGSQGDDK